MRAKFINEYLNYKDILVPKSEEEILDIIEKSGMSPDELLIKSAKNGVTTIVQLALDQGANVHVKNDAPLYLAAENGHYNVVKLLLANGANVHTFNNLALHYAVAQRHTEIVNLLKSYM